MGLVKEPVEVDFVVDPRTLTEAEERAINDFIRADKQRRKKDELCSNASTNPKSAQPA